MANRRVRVNSIYKYDPVLFDILQGPADLPVGTIVRVINLASAPKANTMGMCYVGDVATRKFIGMVCTNSLTPIKR
jgi:hypothetical protein